MRFLFLLGLLLVGCAGSRDVSTLVEKQTDKERDLVVEPVVIDTPFGQFKTGPLRLKETARDVEKSKVDEHETSSSMPAPEVTGFLGSLAGVLTIAGGPGAIAVWSTLKARAATFAKSTLQDKHDEEQQKHADTQRALEETVAGVEAARVKLLSQGEEKITGRDAWAMIRTELERKQSRDTQLRVKAMT